MNLDIWKIAMHDGMPYVPENVLKSYAEHMHVVGFNNISRTEESGHAKTRTPLVILELCSIQRIGIMPARLNSFGDKVVSYIWFSCVVRGLLIPWARNRVQWTSAQIIVDVPRTIMGTFKTDEEWNGIVKKAA